MKMPCFSTVPPVSVWHRESLYGKSAGIKNEEDNERERNGVRRERNGVRNL